MQAGKNEVKTLSGECFPPSLQSFEYLRITDTTDIPEPRTVLKLSGETIAVNADIFAISGASKSGKSGFLSMIITASINDAGHCPEGVEGMEVEINTNKKAVLHFDTEQAAHRHQYNLKMILKRNSMDTCPDHFLSYNIRKMPLSEYQSILTGICKAAAGTFGGIHSIYIDGGADFVADTNDQSNSNEVIKYMEEVAIQYDTAVFILVHTNPGSDKERGHFGSQLQRKAGGILSIKQEGDYSYIEPKMLRYAGKTDIEKLKFTYSKDKGYFIGTGVHTAKNPEDIKLQRNLNKAYELCQNVFGGQKSYTYKEALEEIELQTGKSININKEYFRLMNTKLMILQNENDKMWRINFRYLHDSV